MTFIQVDRITFLNAEVIALINYEGEGDSHILITTKNGRTYTVREPELIATLKTKLAIGV
jgi:hypothetical protein